MMLLKSLSRVDIDEMDIVVLAGWIGGMFGLRVRTGDLDLFCGVEEGDRITLELPDPVIEIMRRKPRGWDKYPEFRANEVGCWMCKRGDWPWWLDVSLR